MAHNSLMCYCKAPHSCFKDLAGYIHWALHLHRVARRRSSNWDLIARYGDVYLIVVYLFTKVLYVANAIAQIFLLSVLLQTNDPFYGITMARNLINGTEWQQSGSFPRLTVCDVEVSTLPYCFFQRFVRQSFAVSDTRSGQSSSPQDSVRPRLEPVQREAIHPPLVLDRLRGHRLHLRSHLRRVRFVRAWLPPSLHSPLSPWADHGQRSPDGRLLGGVRRQLPGHPRRLLAACDQLACRNGRHGQGIGTPVAQFHATFAKITPKWFDGSMIL